MMVNSSRVYPRVGSHRGGATDPQSAKYERSYGFYSEEQRQRFIESSARIAGVGGGGMFLSVALAQEGVGHFELADPERVDETNIGRIPGLSENDIGKWKVDVAARLIQVVNPSAIVEVYGDGITKDNVEQFVAVDSPAGGKVVVFDEIEMTEPLPALWLHRKSREFGRYVISATDVGRGGMVTTYRPDPKRDKHTYESHMGANPRDSEGEYLRKVNGFQFPIIANAPTNGSLNTFLSIRRGASLPATLRSVLTATNMAMDEYEKILTLGDPRYDDPHLYPRVHCSDPSRGEDFVTSRPRFRAVIRIACAIARDKIGLNPPASYSLEDIQRREKYRQSLDS